MIQKGKKYDIFSKKKFGIARKDHFLITLSGGARFSSKVFYLVVKT